ncbi:MAG: hypothetical protein CML19_01515 [Pusillimonas sp.]|nr:hypothetical protein [Pusillimonas sp.]
MIDWIKDRIIDPIIPDSPQDWLRFIPTGPIPSMGQLGNFTDTVAGWLEGKDPLLPEHTRGRALEEILKGGIENVLRVPGAIPSGGDVVDYFTQPTDSYYNSPEYRSQMAEDMRYDMATGTWVPFVRDPKMVTGSGFIDEVVDMQGNRTPGRLPEMDLPVASETDVMDSWMGLFGGQTGAAPPIGNPAAAMELAGLAPSNQFAPPPYAGPSLENALASEVAMIDEMVTTGMMDVNAAEMAYNQLLDKYITGFTGSTGQFVPGFVPRQQMVIDEYTQGVSDRDIARGEELLTMKQQMLDSGVNPDLIASDIEFINALYDGVAETETNYLNAVRDIGLLAEASLRTEGAQRFGAARGDINRTSSMMTRQLNRDARQAETLGPEFGLDPAQYFTGTMAGLDMATIGEGRRKEKAGAAERSLDRALDEAYRSAQLAMDQGAEPDYEIINWYMNQISQDPNVVLPDEIAPVVMKELAEAGMMDLLIPESSKALTPSQEIDLFELMAMTSGQSTEYFIFAQSMAGLLDSAQINEIWTQATKDVALTRGSVLDAANGLVSEMGLG